MKESKEASLRAVAERRRVEAAMQTWRRQIAQDGYAGLKRPDIAYSMASIIDMMSLDWRALDEKLRSAVLGFVEQVEQVERDERERNGG